MIITKIFTGECSHEVPLAFSSHCALSNHGHSYKLEVRLQGYDLDNAGMLYDFGLMKLTIKDLVNSSDHCHLFWDKHNEEYKNFFKKYNDRWIETPFNTTAEQLSMFYFVFIQYILDHTIYSNGEGKDLKVHSVTYHETATGSATCDIEDIKRLWKPEWFEQVKFSDGIIREWSDELKRIMLNGETIVNPKSSAEV